MIRRRSFITLLGGAAAAWPLAARAQQGERVRRIGALMYLAADDAESPARVAAFARGLQELGWIEGRNIRIDYRWGGGDLDRVRRYAAELVALAPDVILVSSGSALAALQNATRTVPIVFVNVTDPVGEQVENSSVVRDGLVAQPSRLRSRVTNGKSPFVEADGRGPWARRWRDILAEIISDLGGYEAGLSEGQKQLARRCATISLACERMEGEAAAGAEIDLDVYGTLTDRLGRALQRLGLERRARTVEEQSLAEIIAEDSNADD